MLLRHQSKPVAETTALLSQSSAWKGWPRAQQYALNFYVVCKLMTIVFTQQSYANSFQESSWELWLYKPIWMKTFFKTKYFQGALKNSIKDNNFPNILLLSTKRHNTEGGYKVLLLSKRAIETYLGEEACKLGYQSDFCHCSWLPGKTPQYHCASLCSTVQQIQ